MARHKVLLWQAELTDHDLLAVQQQLRHAPFVDQQTLSQWEGLWEKEWQRFALAFADPEELLRSLRLLFAWPPGQPFALDPFLEPIWQEAVSANSLWPCWPDLQPCSGELRPPFIDRQGMVVPELSIALQSRGWPMPDTKQSQQLCIEEISATPLANGRGGEGCIQLYFAGGNQWLAAGGSALLLTDDAALYAQLRTLRQRIPTPVACAVGIAQWRSLPQRWQRRQELWTRYQQLLRGQGCWQLPQGQQRDRCWPFYGLRLASLSLRQQLQGYLQRVAISAAPPCWFTLPAEGAYWPGWQAFNGQRLAIPCHAALDDREQKHIINRLHRWVSAHGSAQLALEGAP
ncbi:DegT/DnrJ/EryC1/StrS family aminotransferase [Candidatus Magnetaquicoccus inordinatus]|uniref:DegT/DnrJ/EryC1/StrS family aminotransferase n=1 Tax=Candidatus Magnetaquicoccus inordinatus TaxID=2496818 RepID=UPI00102BB629|nr:DegT/DnrJ/EryC1/StrS family aminotransferase [Candidatus Magnetaquicoccus inordinatus]